MQAQMLPARPALIPFNNPALRSQAQYDGEWHEYKMHRWLEERCGAWYVPSPWFRYRRWGEWRYCQPDGLLFSPDGRLTIIEAKLAHTPQAYRQLAGLYRPVVAAVFPSWTVCLLEVTRWYRSDVLAGRRYPVPVRLIDRPEAASPDVMSVMVLQPKWKREKEMGRITNPAMQVKSISPHDMGGGGKAGGGSKASYMGHDQSMLQRVGEGVMAKPSDPRTAPIHAGRDTPLDAGGMRKPFIGDPVRGTQKADPGTTAAANWHMSKGKLFGTQSADREGFADPNEARPLDEQDSDYNPRASSKGIVSGHR